MFRARRLEGTVAPLGTSKVTLHGVLNLHGADHEVKLPATVKIAGGRVTADATLTIPYVAWGMTDPSKFVLRVGKTVDVSVHVEGTLGG